MLTVLLTWLVKQDQFLWKGRVIRGLLMLTVLLAIVGLLPPTFTLWRVQDTRNAMAAKRRQITQVRTLLDLGERHIELGRKFVQFGDDRSVARWPLQTRARLVHAEDPSAAWEG